MLMLKTLIKMKKQKSEQEFGTSFLGSGALDELFPKASFIRELDTPHGRPDVVVFDTKPNSRRSILGAMRTSPSTTAFAMVFFALKESRSGLDLDELTLKTKMSYSYLRYVLRSMQAHGLVVVRRDGYRLSRKALIPQTGIISIEFKLHDWRKALQQAVRHLAFADKAYVVMPVSKRDLLISNLEVFSNFGISVGVYDAETEVFEKLSELSQPLVSEVSKIDLVSRIWLNKELIGQL